VTGWADRTGQGRTKWRRIVSEADTARVDVDVGVDADADADADACGRSIVGAAATGGRCWSRARRESAADTVRDGPSPGGGGGGAGRGVYVVFEESLSLRDEWMVVACTACLANMPC
jgi:hypothetical protein